MFASPRRRLALRPLRTEAQLERETAVSSPSNSNAPLIAASIRTIVEIVVAIAIVVIGALAFRSWIAARDAATQLAATVATQKQILQQATTREQQRDAVLAQTLKAIQRAKAAVRTPAQAAAQILKALPPLPAPILLDVPAATRGVAAPTGASSSSQAASPATSAPPRQKTDSPSGTITPDSAQEKPAEAPSSNLAAARRRRSRSAEATSDPHSGQDAREEAAPVPAALSSPETAPPATATIPQSDLQPIYDYIEDCRACSAKLAAAQADLSDERTKEAVLVKERNAATRAAHGGSFWTRFKASAKYLLIGSAAGAIITLAAGGRR